jgi:HEAT repeat protein
MEDFQSHFEAGCEEAAAVPAMPQPRSQRPKLVLVLVVALVAMAAGGGIVYMMLPTDGGKASHPAGGRDVGVKQVKVLTEAAARKEALRRVKAALRSPKGSTRILVTDLLRLKRKPPEVLREDLRHVLQHDEQPEVLVNTANILARVGDRAAVPRLVDLLSKAPPRTKTGWAYAEALVMLGEEKGRRRLHRDLQALQHAKGAARISFPYILPFIGRLGDKEARTTLSAHVKGVMDPKRRYELMGYLAEMGDSKAKADLVRVVTTAEWPERVRAARALVKVDAARARETLRAALDKTHGGDRLIAAIELASVFKDASSAKILVEFLESRKHDRLDRERAVVALGHLHLSPKTLINALGDESVGLAAAVALLR